jgi:hypothetical protein
MTEPRRELYGIPVESQVDPRSAPQSSHPPVERDMRLRSSDYGNGTVVCLLPTGVQILWDTPLTGTTTQLVIHDYSYVARLERI